MHNKFGFTVMCDKQAAPSYPDGRDESGVCLDKWVGRNFLKQTVKSLTDLQHELSERKSPGTKLNHVDVGDCSPDS